MPADVALARARPAAPSPLAEFWHSFRENRGAVIGLILSAALSGLIANMLFGVQPLDPITHTNSPSPTVSDTSRSAWTGGFRPA